MKAKTQIKRKPPMKFIDRLEAELKKSGATTKRGSMNDYSLGKDGKLSKQADDHCEWVKVILKNKSGDRKFEVEFYFSNNSLKLESVHIYKKKKKRGYGMAELIATDKPVQPLHPQVQQEQKQQKELHLIYDTHKPPTP